MASDAANRHRHPLVLVVRYGVYSTGVGWTDVEIARDTDINWSTDFGATWLSDLPADYDDVTDVRVRYGTVWTDIPDLR